MYASRPPQSGSPSSALLYRVPNSLFISTSTPKLSANSLKRPTQAFRSEVQLLQCTMATGLPSGVVTISSSGCTFFSSCSSTIIANTEVPADTFPVRGRTLLVAVIPVPASPSGGQSGAPASSSPAGSRSFAPSSVRIPACSPAVCTFGRISRIFQGYPLGAMSSWN